MDYTGTGNTLNLDHPRVLQMVMDSLRYWVTRCHVDGFRFDLAATLARELARRRPARGVLRRDPPGSGALAVKLIAEPWDSGPGGYQVGGFPPRWTEWNDAYRDTMRDFWRGDRRMRGDFASRFTGSSDLFEPDGRAPFASRQLRHRARRLHARRPRLATTRSTTRPTSRTTATARDDNRSWNCGVEGPTDDPEIAALRARQQRNLLATLLLSQGVPMLLGGDEFGRTQRRQQQRLVPGQRDLVARLGDRRQPACSSSPGG